MFAFTLGLDQKVGKLLLHEDVLEAPLREV